MAMTFIMASRLTPDALRSPRSLEELEKKAAQMVRMQCPEVAWIANYSILGPYDYIDIFRAPDLESAMKVGTIIRTFGHAYTEIWTATEWETFKGIIREIPATEREAGARELRQ